MRASKFFYSHGYEWRVSAGSHPGELVATCEELGVSVESCDGRAGLETLAAGVARDHAAGKLREHHAP